MRNIFARPRAGDPLIGPLDRSDTGQRRAQAIDLGEAAGQPLPPLNGPELRLSRKYRAKQANDDVNNALPPQPAPAGYFGDTSVRGRTRDLEEREDRRALEGEPPGFRNPGLALFGGAGDAARGFRGNKRRQLHEVFTPTKPVGKSNLFVGRHEILRSIVSAIEEERAHVIIHGSRGIGKTSLANMLAENAEDAGYHILRYSCSSDASFEGLFRALLSGLPAKLMDRSSRGRGKNVETFDQLLPAGTFGSTDVAHALEFLFEPTIFVIDEFDRVTNDDVKRKLAETIKSTSDVSNAVTFVILGIGKTLEDLIGEHPSIQRHVYSINLPLMQQAELRSLIRWAEQNADIAFDDVTRDLVVALSKGLPYYVQLMGLHAGRSAIKRNSKTIEICDLRIALQTIVESMDPFIVEQYDTTTRGGRNLFVTDVLFAAAVARHDPYGAFTVGDATKAMRKNIGKDTQELTIHRALSQLSENGSASILDKVRLPSGVLKYSFVNPGTRQYILFRQTRDRGIV